MNQQKQGGKVIFFLYKTKNNFFYKFDKVWIRDSDPGSGYGSVLRFQAGFGSGLNECGSETLVAVNNFNDPQVAATWNCDACTLENKPGSVTCAGNSNNKIT